MTNPQPDERLREEIAALVYTAMWPDNDPAIPWEAIKNAAARAPIYTVASQIISGPLAAYIEWVEGWQPIETAPCDGLPVVLGNAEWEGVVSREWHRETDRDRDLREWTFGPTHWMRPGKPPSSLQQGGSDVG